MEISSSIPTLTEFDPNIIPYQMNVIRDVREGFDYDDGVHEVMLSGSVGSAKSLLMAHIAVTHCLLNRGANVLIGRKTMPSLRDTLFQMIVDHVGLDVDVEINQTRGIITFLDTESKIFCYSWADKKYKKVRSYALSMAVIEEITENDDMEFLKEIRMRLQRIPHIKENLLLGATNPDSPGHWAYEYFINGAKLNTTRHVYYSKTSDNPFLAATYIESIKSTLTERECQRMLFGLWIEISRDVIYYAYNSEQNEIDEYIVDLRYPIYISFDFNIGIGKPMSACVFQYKPIEQMFYFFNESIMHGSNTKDIIDDLKDRGILDYNAKYFINGDATGKARSTNYNKTDYDVIDDELRNYFIEKLNRYLDYEIDVPASNPPIRKRHLIVNGRLKNADKKSSIKIVRTRCKTLIKGFRLSKLLKGTGYKEDDKDEWQHVTTAAGYGVVRQVFNEDSGDRITTSRTM